MDQPPRHRLRRRTTNRSTQPPPQVSLDHLLSLSKPTGFILTLAASQLDLIAAILVSLSSPILSLLPGSQSARARARALLRRLALGLLAAIYAAAALLALTAVAALIGLVVVWFWAEEPVFVREPLYFDYTQRHPSAAVVLAARRGRAVPAGHTVRASLAIVMPESDYNVWVGVFQVNAEAISTKGAVIETSSQPCMLRFRSLPVRLMRTLAMGIPLLLGISTESQKIVIQVLRYKESHQNTEVIRVKLMPRAGTSDVPQIYTAELYVTSQPPWTKKLVHNWKWTSYIWISFYVYIMLLIVLICSFKQLVLPRQVYRADQHAQVVKDHDENFVRDAEISDAFYDRLRKWREQRRSKRKASMTANMCLLEPDVGSSTTTTGETSEVVNDSGECPASESSACAES